MHPLLAGTLGAAVLIVSVALGFIAGGSFGEDELRVAGGGGTETASPEGMAPSPDSFRARPGDGPRAPQFSLPAFGGAGTVTAAEFDGTPLVLNFWASWCPFCIQEMPGLEAVNQRFGGAVAFLGVDLQDDPGLAEDLIERTGVTYQIAEDPGGGLFAEIGGLGMPTTLLITADGHVADRITGPLDAENLEQLVLEHLVEEVG